MASIKSVENGDYEIRNVTHEGHVVSKLDTNAAAIFGSTARFIVRWDQGKGSYSIIHKASGLSLDIIEGDREPKPVILHPQHGGNNQRWTITKSDAGGYTISSLSSPGLAVSITDLSNKHIYNLYDVRNTEDGLQRWEFKLS